VGREVFICSSYAVAWYTLTQVSRNRSENALNSDLCYLADYFKVTNECVAVCCSVLQSSVVCFSVLQCV